MSIRDPILHAVVIEPDASLHRAVRRWLRTERVRTTEVSTVPEGLRLIEGEVDLVVAPGTDVLSPDEPEVFGTAAIFRAVAAVRALPADRVLASGLRARALPVVLTVRDPRGLDGPPPPGVVRAPVPLHAWEFLAAAARALEIAHDALLDAAGPRVVWDGADYRGPPRPVAAFEGPAEELRRLLTRLRLGGQALHDAALGAPGHPDVARRAATRGR